MVQIENLYQKFLASTGVTTDTRNVSEGNIFFALKGEKFNGNKFAKQALESGAALAVVDEIAQSGWKELFGERLVLTTDVLQTLQQLAGHHRTQLKCPVLAITGSNGKTTTKELTATVLSKKFKTYATKGNLNNHIGIPLTLLAIKPDVEFAVIEMGANHQGEIASYCEYVKPDYGLITNVGMAHTEGFGGFEGVVKGKTELYKYVIEHKGKIFVNAENPILFNKIRKETTTITYASTGNPFCKASPDKVGEFLSLNLDDNGTQTPIQTQMIGAYNFENVLSAICIGKYFGVGIEAIKTAVEGYIPSNNRSQKITWGSNRVILDAYNANPASMGAALKNFESLNAANKVVILGEMMELGQYAEAEHKKIASLVDKMHLAQRIFVGSGFAFLKGKPGYNYFETTDELKSWFKKQNFQNSNLLVKGSRKNELEKIFRN